MFGARRGLFKHMVQSSAGGTPRHRKKMPAAPPEHTNNDLRLGSQPMARRCTFLSSLRK
jgi:hypothetical protein